MRNRLRTREFLARLYRESAPTFNGSDGDGPNGGLLADATGNLYGVTVAGLDNNGEVFELVDSSGSYTEKTIYPFNGNGDGYGPQQNLIADAFGNLYGITQLGGTYFDGTVFELVNSSGSYTEKLLHSFTSGNDGELPFASLVADTAGNLYGTTQLGDANNDGTVFELVNSSGSYTYKVIHTFGGAEGISPGGLTIDASGNLYGTTEYGGDTNNDGTVFELVDSSGSYTEKVLHTFSGNDGSLPYASLIADASGNLYGTTIQGGEYDYGTVFKLSLAAAFNGIPGKPNCYGQSISFDAHKYGGLPHAAKSLGYANLTALQNAVTVYCGGN